LKRLLVIAGLILAALGGGLWWSLRRQPSAAPLDDQGSVFAMQAAGPGQSITYQDAQIPLRAFRWLPPLPGGVLAAQVLSQNDRQRVALFHEGQAQDLLLVLKPAGVGDGFWRFAALREAAMAPGGMILLLYQPGDPGSTELPLALAVDLASQQVRWSCRGAFGRMALAQGADAVYLYGGKGPIQRVALNATGGASLRPAATVIELPPEIPEAEDLLPTGAGGFLVSHRDGLSVFRTSTGWAHFPAPEDRGQDCQGWKSSLTRTGKDIWWQAVPGKLVKVRPDGTPGLEWQGELPQEDPFARDARLLRVLGADGAGCLWFALASPVPVPAAAPAPPGKEEPAPEAAPPDPGQDWGPYVAAGLDRLYRWNPARDTLDRVSLRKAWAALNPPANVAAPVQGQGVIPAAGTLLAEGARCAWWLPLGALPLERVQAM
jgi:hypothetical protein